jgi:hypothetical protein
MKNGKTFMQNRKKIKPEIENYYDNEIDLFELFKKIWKWKWLIAIIIIIFCSITLLYLNLKPATYTIASTLRIGKIAGIVIEQDSDVLANFSSNIFQVNDICLSILDIQIQNSINKDLIKISTKANSPDIAFSCLEKATNNLINRHNIIYRKALKKIDENRIEKKPIIIQPQYFLETYTYPSSLVSKPEKPVNQDEKKIANKVFISFFSSLFIGVFLSFFIEYILSRRRRE